MTQPTQAAPNADDFLSGGGAPSVSFKNIGDVLEGTVVAKDVVHKTKFGTTEKEYYKDGNPIWQLVVTLQTNLRDPDRDGDDGKRRIFAPPQMKVEISKAVKAAGLKTLPLGTHLRIRFEREVPNSGSGGGSPKKEYSVVVTSPADVALDAATPPATVATATTSAAPAVNTAAPSTVPNLADASPELLALLSQMAQAQAK